MAVRKNMERQMVAIVFGAFIRAHVHSQHMGVCDREERFLSESFYFHSEASKARMRGKDTHKRKIAQCGTIFRTTNAGIPPTTPPPPHTEEGV